MILTFKKLKSAQEQI